MANEINKLFVSHPDTLVGVYCFLLEMCSMLRFSDTIKLRTRKGHSESTDLLFCALESTFSGDEVL